MISENQAILDAVRKAARLCQQVQSDSTDLSMEKADKSPVTVADFGAQALICRALGDAFPADVVVAEEDSEALRENSDLLKQVVDYVNRFSERQPVQAETVCDWIDRGRGEVGERFWTLDPIDGTKGFLRKDQYAIALALVVGGEVKLGVLGCPNLPQRLDDPGAERGWLFVAVRGEGAHMHPLDGEGSEALHVKEAPHRFAESFESVHSDQNAQIEIARRLQITEPPIRMDSQVKYGLVARGDASVYLRLSHPAHPDYRECIWDHAAGMLIVEEAGGTVTDAQGSKLDFLQGRRMTANRGIVATNGTLHQRVLDSIAG